MHLKVGRKLVLILIKFKVKGEVVYEVWREFKINKKIT